MTDAWSLVAVTGTLFVAAVTNGLAILDLSNPISPVRVAHYPTEGPARKVCVERSYAYLACGTNGVEILDVSEPDDRQFASHVDTGGYAIDLCPDGSELEGDQPAVHGLTLSWPYLLVLRGFQGFQVLDIHEPSSPQLLATYADSPRSKSTRSWTWLGVGLSRSDGCPPIRYFGQSCA